MESEQLLFGRQTTHVARRLLPWLIVVLVITFRGFGIVASLLLAVACNYYFPREGQIGWPVVGRMFNSILIVSIAVTAISFMFYRGTELAVIFKFVSSACFVEMPLDRIVQKLTVINGQVDPRYAELWFNPFWHTFYPASLMGILASSIPFAIMLGRLAFANVVLKQRVADRHKMKLTLAGLVMFSLATVAAFFTGDSPFLPGQSTVTGVIRPLITGPLLLVVPAFAALFAFAFLDESRKSKTKGPWGRQ